MSIASRPARLPLSTVLAFACTSLPISALTIAVSVMAPRHMAQHVGIGLGMVGTIFFAVRMIDVGFDFAIGIAMDRTRSRWGRYRLWTVIGAPILMLGIFMVFMAAPGTGPIYLIGWLLLMYIGYSILNLSHTAWASTLATSYDERSRLFAAMTAVGVAGAGSVLLIPTITRALGLGTLPLHASGWMVIALTPIAVALVVARTPERIAPDVPGQKFRLRDYWDLIARPTMSRVLISDVCLTLGPGWMSALYLFFFTDSRGFTEEQASLLLLVYILAGFAGAPLMGRLAVMISKHRAVMVATTGYSLVLCTLMLVPRGNMLIALAPMFVAGFLAAGFNVLTRAMTADIADEVRLEQGKERAGLLFALTTLTAKIAGAFAIVLTFWIIERLGYVAESGATNTPAAIRALEWTYLLGPIFFVMAGGLVFIGYKLGSAEHADIRRQLDERDALYDEAPIVESVTGAAAIATPPSR